MNRPTLPPALPLDLLDGMINALERIAAVADLLETAGACAAPGRLRDETLAGAGDIIGGEAARMLALVRSYEPKHPAP